MYFYALTTHAGLQGVEVLCHAPASPTILNLALPAGRGTLWGLLLKSRIGQITVNVDFCGLFIRWSFSYVVIQLPVGHIWHNDSTRFIQSNLLFPYRVTATSQNMSRPGYHRAPSTNLKGPISRPLDGKLAIITGGSRGINFMCLLMSCKYVLISISRNRCCYRPQPCFQRRITRSGIYF